MRQQQKSQAALNIELGDEVAKFVYDPLGFVKWAYPWGKGELQGYDGPDQWQAEFLKDLGEMVKVRRFDTVNAVSPIRMAVAAGQGIGKGVMAAFLVNWIMSTRPWCRGTITANTAKQLETKTWATIQTWTKRCITAGWFEMTGERMYYKAAKEKWFCSPQTCREENSEAFAGQHAADSTSFYLLDEASAIPDAIWQVAEGGLTDGEPMIFAFGNPTRNSGKFYRITFGSERERWYVRSVDSRTSRFTNKEQIQEWIRDYGENSDFVRVRVYGLPPKQGDLQYIDSDRVNNAQHRVLGDQGSAPLIAGLDCARGGDDNTYLWFRRGRDARSIKPIWITGQASRNTSFLATKIATVLDTEYGGRKIEKLFVDGGGGGGGGPLCDDLKRLGYSRQVVEVSFAGKPPDPHYANMRSYMWGRMREWLEVGCIPLDPDLEVQLTGPGLRTNKADTVYLESKEDMQKRGLASPDKGDALALTFAQPVAGDRITSIKRNLAIRRAPPPMQVAASRGWMY